MTLRGTAVVTGAELRDRRRHRTPARRRGIRRRRRRSARRPARALADEIGARFAPLDVTDTASVDAFCAEIDDCRLLVNNAGGALGLDSVAEADEDAVALDVRGQRPRRHAR